MDIKELTQKRSILFSTRIRFAPEVQPVKDTAIDKIIEQNLLVIKNEEGLTLQELEEQGIFCFGGGVPAFRRQDIENSLDRLIKDNRVISSGERDLSKYKLSDQTKKELTQLHKTTEQRFLRIVDKLFKNAQEGSSVYTTPFLDCICIIFSRLGESYVRLLKGEIDPDELVNLPSINNAFRKIESEYSNINQTYFKEKIISFFQDSDPDYDAIKWNMAQNYYIVHALGLDISGRLLSKEIFGNALFYLDTNVLLHALEPKARHHGSFKALSDACRKLQIETKVCQISLDELRKSVAYHREIIKKVANQIPEETAPKVRGIFYKLYHEKQQSTESVNLDELFINFENPMNDLSKLYNIERIDDVWFTKAETQKETEKLSERIRLAYEDKRGYLKSKVLALHDAILLRWIHSEPDRTGKNAWLVTLDTSLPSFFSKKDMGKKRSLAITLDALLQWISPIAIHDDNKDEVAEIYSEALKYLLLPKESFFDLKDFLVFAEMEWSCKELPAEDVEESIRHLKINAPNLNPSDPIDREKIAHELSKFFADPTRKYKAEIHKKEAEIAKRDARIAELEKETLKQSAFKRFFISFIIFVIYEGVIGILSNKYGAGNNLFQKMIESWQLFAIGIPFLLIILRFMLWKERIRALGLPIPKWLKD